MKTSSAKAKGKRLILEFKEMILKYYKDSLSEKDLIVMPTSVPGVDLTLSPKAREVFPFGVEGKNQQNISIWAAIKQCEDNAIKEELIPLLVFKRNHAKTYVTIEAEHFLKLITHAKIDRDASPLPEVQKPI